MGLLDQFKQISMPEIGPMAPPPVAYHFLVMFHGVGSMPAPNPLDIRFQRVSGMEMSISNMETRNFGGKAVRMPGLPEYTNLQLERGWVTGMSIIRKELEFTFENLKFCPRNVHVMLLNESSLPVASWLFFDAFPVRWRVGDLDASQSSILVESMELSYSRFKSLSL